MKSDDCHNNASILMQRQLSVITEKSLYVTFTLRRGNCNEVTLNNNTIRQAECVKHLGMHIDKRLTWKPHIKVKNQQLIKHSN